MSFVRGLLYWAAQIGGAVVASLILRSLIPLDIYKTVPSAALLGCHTVNEKMTALHGFWFEIVLTFIFIFVVFGTAISPFVGKMAPVSGGSDSYGPGKLTPLALGLTILVLHLVGIPFTGASMNPARSFGPALVGSCWADHWVYWAGPLAGSTFAALIAHTLFLSNPAEIAKSFAIIRGDRALAQIPSRKHNENEPQEQYGMVQEEE
jgi:aquaporin TIP